MAKYTNTLNLKKPDSEDFFDVSDQNGNMDTIDSAIEGLSQLAKSVGTSNAIELSVSHFKSYSNCLKISFVASANNNGTATTVNVNQWGTKNLYKPNTTTAPVLIAGKAYDIWFDEASDCFFLKASAEGDATAAHVLAGKTFSNDEDTGLSGEMINNRGHVSASGISTTGTTLRFRPQQGYYSGDNFNSVQWTDSDFLAENIVSGKKIFNVIGTANELQISKGTGITDYNGKMTVSGLAFKPRYVIATTVASYGNEVKWNNVFILSSESILSWGNEKYKGLVVGQIYNTTYLRTRGYKTDQINIDGFCFQMVEDSYSGGSGYRIEWIAIG